ncbi:MAG TPA: hypothetical protein PLV92_25885, partial [Pirellulaceae bacterium]|nr:hypothetical protein [Pirellulaceae bacterium]
MLATDGNGLHTVDLRTHHVSTDDRANASLASNHLGSVAVTERGVVGVSTVAKSGTMLPSGVDVKFDGRWRTLIHPAACETPGGGEIEFTFRLPDSAEGAEQLLVTRRGPLIYHHARRSLRAVERRDASTGADDDRILGKLSAAAL